MMGKPVIANRPVVAFNVSVLLGLPRLDEINADATGILSDYIIEHPEAVHTCVDLVSVFRKLERSGDHITNIAEEIVFFIDAKVLKHRGKTDENYPEK